MERPRPAARRGWNAMARLNFVLTLVVTVLALAAVTAQHRARTAFQALEAAEQRARALQDEYSQLQLEMSTWAQHARIERIATERLRMRLPDAAVHSGGGR
jgi:cell division protein FtsL